MVSVWKTMKLFFETIFDNEYNLATRYRLLNAIPYYGKNIRYSLPIILITLFREKYLQRFITQANKSSLKKNTC